MNFFGIEVGVLGIFKFILSFGCSWGEIIGDKGIFVINVNVFVVVMWFFFISCVSSNLYIVWRSELFRFFEVG